MKKYIVVVAFALSICIFQWCACNSSDGNTEQGFKLANQYCASCHMLPEPALLDKQTWVNYVLPKMGTLLGFTSLGLGSYVGNGRNTMPLSDWNKLVLYYYKQAPDQLPPGDDIKIDTLQNQFTVLKPFQQIEQPATTMVRFVAKSNSILFADASHQMMYAMEGSKVIDSFKVATGVSHCRKRDDQFYVLSMGVLYPSDERLGKLVRIESAGRKQKVLIDSLQRPVYADYADLNNDGTEDVVICEFGNTTGTLSWFNNAGNDHYTRQVLRQQPGAVSCTIKDMNGDALPDIVALMAQGDEGVFIYYNKGNGTFEEQNVLRFPPSYGSNSMQLIDINGDGFMDILTTNGDNGDYPPVMKPYHGARIFINDGNNHFKQSVFLHVNGIGKAIATDFNHDGRLDIVSISYFPDYEKKPQESFIYWKNKGDDTYDAFSFKGVNTGRWISMDVDDNNGDGYPDIVLGNANFQLGNVPQAFQQKWRKEHPSILVLTNKPAGK